MNSTQWSLPKLLQTNPYPGRGIVMGMSPQGDAAVMAYFIMGRSTNSRNRVFEVAGEELKIRLFDESAVTDPSLILYAPTATVDGRYILTNGDQTDTIVEALRAGQRLEDALNTRTFEPVAPNYTPMISGLLTKNGYCLSILRASDEAGSACDRLYFHYPLLPGTGRFIHTYETDGNPLPSFAGEPKKVLIPEDTGAFALQLWDSLNEENRVALYVRRLDLKTGNTEHYVYNRHQARGGAHHG